MQYGYARVSTIDQDTHMQLDALKRAGIRKIFSEQSSSVGARPALQQALRHVGPGDSLVVYKLDRVARSLKDLLSILDRLEAARCGFRSLTEPIDTATPAGRLMLQILGAVAEFERTLIRERVVSGQLTAVRRGVQFGRRRQYLDEKRTDIWRLWADGHRVAHVARMVGVSPPTVYRVIEEELGETRPRMPILGPLLELHK